MLIDWGNRENGWRVWEHGFDDPPDYTFHPDLPPTRVTFHRDGTRGWLETDMAEMTEVDALKVRLADKQAALEEAIQQQAQMLFHIRAIKDGALSIGRIVMNENGYQIVDLPTAQAEQVASEADRT